MATFNSANNNYQSGNKTLFEVGMLATSNGVVVDNNNPLPVTLGSSNVNITANGSINVSVPSTINVASAPDNPVHTHVTEIGTSGILNVPYLPVSGNVIVSNGYPTTQNVAFSNQSVYVTGGNLAVSFPATQNVAFSNQSVYVTGGNLAVSFPATQNVQVVSNSTNYVYTQAAPTWSVDALTKLRVSTIQNQDFFTPVVDDDTTYKWNQTLTGTQANSLFLANTSEISITSGNSASGSSIRQTYIKYKIIPGTSHTVYTTVNFNANSSETGVTKRTGLFDTNNGVFWEQNANTLAVVVRRTLANGSIVEDRTYANSFSTDKLDGTGPSGFNIFTKGLNNYYTFWFDLIGGRTGRIRFGMGGPNGPQICHVQSYSGNNAGNTNFVSATSLPLRREIFNSTTQSTIPYFNMSGIAYQAEAPTRYNASPSTAYNINGYVPGNSLTPIITIGLRAGVPYIYSDIQPGEFTLVEQNNQGKNSTAATFLYTVVYNANVNGTYAYSGNGSVSNTNVGRSAKMWTWGNTATITGGLTVLSGITQSGIGQNVFDGLPDTFNLGSDINGNPATLTICVQQLTAGGGSSNVVATWNFVEQL
jgi:hypothetical protein